MWEMKISRAKLKVSSNLELVSILINEMLIYIKHLIAKVDMW